MVKKREGGVGESYEGARGRIVTKARKKERRTQGTLNQAIKAPHHCRVSLQNSAQPSSEETKEAAGEGKEAVKKKG